MWYDNKYKTIAEQASALRSRLPNFKVNSSSESLKAIGGLEPTPRSEKYIIELKYQLKKPPQIFILTPQLIKNFNDDEIPHLYPGDKLCLYQPKYREFNYTDLISETIIPWTSLWLYYYEIWHTTGDWMGGGEHPKKTDSVTKVSSTVNQIYQTHHKKFSNSPSS